MQKIELQIKTYLLKIGLKCLGGKLVKGNLNKKIEIYVFDNLLKEMQKKQIFFKNNY